MPVAVPLDSKHTEVNFSPNSTDLLCLQLIQVPRSLDLVVFVSTQTITTHDNNDRTDCFTPCACVQGNHKKKKKKKKIHYGIGVPASTHPMKSKLLFMSTMQ